MLMKGEGMLMNRQLLEKALAAVGSHCGNPAN
jgi:hypothetical protein